MKLLHFSSLYPDSTRPNFGVFVENRLRQLLAYAKMEARVIAPVPWFPLSHPIFGSYSKYARVSRHEVWHGIDVDHPRYPVVPKFGMIASPFLMATALKRVFRHVLTKGYAFNLIDAHYFFPDGVAAVMLGLSLKRPVVITARGTDLNLIAQYYFPRRMIQWAARKAAALITVSKALKDQLVSLGVSENKVNVFHNGVDLNRFRPTQDRRQLRERLEIKNHTLLSVGALIPLKGHDLVIRSLTYLNGFNLMIVGEGTEEQKLRKLVRSLNLDKRVQFLGTIAHEELAQYYSAADALVLASSREGWPNVLLESMACGTPVISTRAGGTVELITTPEAGVLTEKRNSESIAEAVNLLFSNYPDRSNTRHFAEQFSWDATTKAQVELFTSVLDRESLQ